MLKPKAPPKFFETFIGKLLVKIVYAFLGFLSAYFTPFWPTEPAFEAGSPSLASPFDVPFTIANKSKLFKITNLTITCEIVEALNAQNGGLSGISLAVEATNYILPNEAPIYVCPLNRAFRLAPGSPITRVAIRFRYKYSQSFLWSETNMSEKESKLFWLITNVSPQRWTTDRLLN
jgi:hypothetical protein